MKLLVDVGNSRIKWAYSQDGRLSEVNSATCGITTLPVLLAARWQKKPDGIWISNVAGAEIQWILQAWIAREWGLQAVFPHSAAQAGGVRSAYPQPERLGVDRWLALIAARQMYPQQNCLVVDCGSAVTLDWLGADGVHAGGWIAPGLQAMRQCLSQALENLRGLDFSGDNADWIGRDTQTGVKAGTLYAVAGLIDKTMNECKSRHGDGRCVMTGGDSAALLELLAHPAEYAPDLVLRGLALLAADETL